MVLPRTTARNALLPAETASFASPVPTQIVASEEYMPTPQNARQREVEARLKALSSDLAKRQGMSRRRFFQTAAGMAASFVAMNEVYGPLFAASLAEAATPEMAEQRTAALAGQFVMDTHTHFLRDDSRLAGFVKQREAVGKAGWNKALADKEQTLDDLKYDNYFKEIYLDSDTKVALLTNSPSEVPEDWFLTNEMVF
ncbi:MAG: amidohydrolase, partial [Allosphingosinicella sp.]